MISCCGVGHSGLALGGSLCVVRNRDDDEIAPSSSHRHRFKGTDVADELLPNSFPDRILVDDHARYILLKYM